MVFEIFERRNMLGLKRWYFRIRAANGEMVAQSEAYTRKASAEATVRAIMRAAASADVINKN